MSFTDKTVRFDRSELKEATVSETLTHVYHALEEKGYDPVNQIVGYLLSEDPAYIPRYKEARNMIRTHDRNEIMEILVRDYLKHHGVND